MNEKIRELIIDRSIPCEFNLVDDENILNLRKGTKGLFSFVMAHLQSRKKSLIDFVVVVLEYHG